MENRFQHAMLLFGGLAQRVQEWERVLSREEARVKTEELLLRLSDEDFEMVRDLIRMFGTEPGRRLTGAMDSSYFERTLETIAIRRLPVN